MNRAPNPLRYVLLAGIAVLVLAQQPAKSPKDQRATEANRTESTAHAKSTESNQTPSAQTTPAPTPAPVATESQRSAATANDPTQTSRQQTDNEDYATQRKLTLFTGVLAGVGVLQLVIMFLTWLVYRRQAHEMRRQRHEMRRQRHVMFRQWKAMGSQTEVLKASVASADKSADAAKMSADALVNSERGWVLTEIQWDKMGLQRTATGSSVTRREHDGIVGTYPKRNALD